jgi:rod shape-determining protein MreB
MAKKKKSSPRTRSASKASSSSSSSASSAGTLRIGVDLGTSRSAIAASNGKRKWVESYVGWPKDFISEKVLGESVLFGAKALENRLSVDLYRPLEHGVIKEGSSRDGEAVEALFGHLLELVGAREKQTI